jgi:hypothetical protein
MSDEKCVPSNGDANILRPFIVAGIILFALAAPGFHYAKNYSPLQVASAKSFQWSPPVRGHEEDDSSRELKIRIIASHSFVCPGDGTARLPLKVEVRGVNDNPRCKPRYTWKVNGGRIEGEGPEIIWDLTGVAPRAGVYYDATVTVETGSACGPRRKASAIWRACVTCPPRFTWRIPPLPSATPRFCPSISLGCRATATPGQNVPFSVTLNGGTPGAAPSFKWTVWGGGIIGGQGTDSITVGAEDASGQTILAKVEMGGYGSACSATCVTKVVSTPRPTPTPAVLNSVRLTPSSANVIGGTRQFSAQAFDQFARPMPGVAITFESGNTRAATVDAVRQDVSTGSATATVEGHANGTTHITATGSIAATNVTSDPALLMVTMPTTMTLAVISPADNSTTTGESVTVRGTATGAGSNASAAPHVYVNEREAKYDARTGAWSLDAVRLVMGLNEIAVRAVDRAGNSATQAVTVERVAPPDTTAPSLFISSPSDGASTEEEPITVSGNASDPGDFGSGVSHVTVNGREATLDPGTGSWSLKGLALTLGQNTIEVRAVDHAGNTTPRTLSVKRIPSNHAAQDYCLCNPHDKCGFVALCGIALLCLGAFMSLSGITGALATAEAPSDEVHSTVFAPSVAAPGDGVIVQVFAHLAVQAESLQAMATDCDEDARERGSEMLEGRIERGKKLSFSLEMPDLQIAQPTKSLVWKGEADSVRFNVKVPKDCAPRNINGTVYVSYENAPVAEIVFKLKVVAAAAPQTEAASVATAPPQQFIKYKHAYISYFSKDRKRVLMVLQGMKAGMEWAGMTYFMDKDINSGEYWNDVIQQNLDKSDVVVIFWSTAAKESVEVRKEIEYALQRKGGIKERAPFFRPLTIELPLPMPLPDGLESLHFNDEMLSLIKAEEALEAEKAAKLGMPGSEVSQV